MEKETSIFIDNIRPLFLLLVIFNHCSLNPLIGGDLLIITKMVIGKIMTLSATSMFFLISGYLFFRNVSIVDYGFVVDKLKKRFSSLVLPYFLWNGLALLMVLLIGFYSQSDIGMHTLKDFLAQFWCCHIWNKDVVNIFGVATPMYGPIDLPLWFLRDLIVVTMFSPVILLLIKKLDKYLFVFLIPLFVFSIWVSVPGFRDQAFLFWAIGAYLALRKKSINDVVCLSGLVKVIVLSLTIVTLLSTVYVCYKAAYSVLYNILYRAFTLLMVFCVFILSPVINRVMGNIPALIKESNFFVYAFHAFPIIGPVAFLRGKECMASSSFLQIVFYLMIPVIVYAIGSLCYLLSKTIVPKLTSIFVGGR